MVIIFRKEIILMAYWLFCQVCNQWSRFPTPLSEEKSCTFCNSQYIKSKPPYSSHVDKEVISKLKNLQNKPPVTTGDTTSDNAEAEIIETREIPTIPEEAANDKAAILSEKPDHDEAPVEPEKSSLTEEPATTETSEITSQSEIPSIPEEPVITEGPPTPDEPLEKTAPSSASESQEITPEPVNENTAESEALISDKPLDEAAEDSEIEVSQESSDVDETTATDNMPEESERSVEKSDLPLHEQADIQEPPPIKITISHNLEPKVIETPPKKNDAQAAPVTLETSVTNRTTETTEEWQLDNESPQESEASPTPESSPIIEPTDEVSTTPNANQIPESPEEYEEEIELAGSLSTSEIANNEEKPSDVLPEESVESVSPESTQITVPEETETDIVEEDLDSEQYLDNSQTNEDSNELVSSGPKNIPAHRMYFEDRRRKKKKR
jgi:hypothetical protein